jgi:hypothetical protein
MDRGFGTHVSWIRIRLELGGSRRDLVPFDCAIDGKHRAYDIVRPKIDASAPEP